MTRMNAELHGVDLLKFGAAVLVVCIHTMPLYGAPDIINYVFSNAVARIAVPVFFLSAGFFYCESQKRSGCDFRGLRKYIARLVTIYLVWSCLYLFVDYDQKNFSGAVAVYEYIFRIIFSGSSFHLWFFPSLIWSIVILHLLKLWIKIEWVMVFAFGLYVFACLGDSYYYLDKPVIIQLAVDLWIDVFGGTRNFVCSALVFVSTGYYMAERRLSFSLKLSAGLGVVLLGGVILEQLTLRVAKFSLDHNTGLLLLPASVFAFQAATKWNPVRQFNYKLLRSMSLLIYLVHPYFMYWLDCLKYNHLIWFIVVLSGSAIASVAIISVRWRIVRMLY